MSAIQKELVSATGVKPVADRQAFLLDLMKAITNLTDKAYDALSDEAADWFTAAAEVKNANFEARKKNAKAKQDDLPDFPDYEPEAAPEEGRRRRRAVEDDAPAAQEKRAMEVGDNVKIVTLRGKEYLGEVIELDKKQVVLKDDAGDEIEIGLDKIDTTEIFHGDAKPGGAPEEELDQDPVAVGAEVLITNKRGKEYTGVIAEITEDDIILEDGEEISRDRVETVKILKKAPAAKGKAEKEEAPARSRGRSAPEPEADADAKPKRSSNPAGVSVGGRIREIMCDDLEITEAEVGKVLKKEGLEFRDTSLKMIFKDVTQVFTLLRKNKKLK